MRDLVERRSKAREVAVCREHQASCLDLFHPARASERDCVQVADEHVGARRGSVCDQHRDHFRVNHGAQPRPGLSNG